MRTWNHMLIVSGVLASTTVSAWATCCCYNWLLAPCSTWASEPPWNLTRTCNGGTLACPDELDADPGMSGSKVINPAEESGWTGIHSCHDDPCTVVWIKMRCSGGFCVPTWPPNTYGVEVPCPDESAPTCGA